MKYLLLIGPLLFVSCSEEKILEETRQPLVEKNVAEATRSHELDDLMDFVIPEITINADSLEEAVDQVYASYVEVCKQTRESPLSWNVKYDGEALMLKQKLHYKGVTVFRILRALAGYTGTSCKLEGRGVVFHLSSMEEDAEQFHRIFNVQDTASLLQKYPKQDIGQSVKGELTMLFGQSNADVRWISQIKCLSITGAMRELAYVESLLTHPKHAYLRLGYSHSESKLEPFKPIYKSEVAFIKRLHSCKQYKENKGFVIVSGKNNTTEIRFEHGKYVFSVSRVGLLVECCDVELWLKNNNGKLVRDKQNPHWKAKSGEVAVCRIPVTDGKYTYLMFEPHLLHSGGRLLTPKSDQESMPLPERLPAY